MLLLFFFVRLNNSAQIIFEIVKLPDLGGLETSHVHDIIDDISGYFADIGPVVNSHSWAHS